MKRTSVLVLLVATLISSVTFAKTKPFETKVGSSASFAIIPKLKQKKFDLVYVSQSTAPVTITLLDMRGNELSKERVKGHS